MDPSDTGKRMLDGLAEARKFFGQVSLLLQTADSRMAEAGWECFSTNKCANISGHILRPQQWMPRNIYRFYALSADANDGPASSVMLFVGVLLDRESAWQGFQEPWITFGLYAFEPDQDWQRMPDATWIEATLEDQHDPDGRFHTWDFVEDDPEDDGLIHQSVAAVPLTLVQSEDDLSIRVIEPLLAQLKTKAEALARVV